MYNEKIAARLNDLKYLFPLKKANITLMSKKNEFGDVLKFFAQIDSKNVIQKISFKATGCSTFLVLCDYFCEIAEGKTIDEASKINEEDLMKFATLDQSRHHVYPIILGAFKLLVKKYNKELANKKIVPVDKVETKQVKSNTKKSATKKEVEVLEPEVITPANNENVIEVKKEVKVIQTITETADQKTVVEEKHTSHLLALKQKINNKENNEKAHNHTHSLNIMLNQINKQQDEPVKSKKTEKKSLFSWLKKK